MGEVHAGVLPLNRANLVAAAPLLEAERHVEVVPLGPEDQGLLLLLVCGVRMDLRLKQRVGDEWRDKLALHSEHLQNPVMDGNGELHTCHRTFTYRGYLHHKFDLIQLWRRNIMLDSNVELETFLLLEKKS